MGLCRVCAWCGSLETGKSGVNLEDEKTGAQSKITHSMCASCVHEWKSGAAPAPKVRRQRAAQIARRHEAPSPPGLEAGASGFESDAARPRTGRAT
jgi:hypothetical protein